MGRIGEKLGTAKEKARLAAGKAGSVVKETEGPSPNPMTNLIIADIALRGGGRLLRQAVEKGLLGVKYSPDTAHKLVKGRSLTNSLVATMVARLATRSVPGALLVGGSLLAKTIYDRRKGGQAKVEGQAAVEQRVRKA